ncbi:MAG: hypothetical protein QF662_08325, partial [Phycisphaerae bacterium]|nr:hypothetical protein [Phycisphaerae bacterium]
MMGKPRGGEDKVTRLVHDVVKTYDEDNRINHLGLRPLPSRDEIIEIINGLKEILYPGYFGRQNFTRENISLHIGDRMLAVFRALKEQVY